jgi:hypothetical protein
MIARVMPRRRRPPSQTWRTFLKNHLGSTVAVDFFAVPTLTCPILCVFVVLAHDRRRILHVNVTRHPTSGWTRLQVREAFPDQANARFLLHDGDATFDAAFGRTVGTFGLTSVRTAPRSPWQNPYVADGRSSNRPNRWRNMAGTSAWTSSNRPLRRCHQKRSSAALAPALMNSRRTCIRVVCTEC